MENIDDKTRSIQLSEDIETEGLDLQAGETWIYPTNYPTRDYQYNIIQKALLKNTLVSLPTGLGKTFIAAVIMYNIYRWYPHGKIIFMAPTKPLVKQQVDACYNIMAIPPEVTAELTGAKASSARTNIWTEKRVFFVTPQVLQNDLNKIAELGPKIKCLVFDEAHKAKGNHAYCEVIRRLVAQNHKYFRVLALSATPGSNVNDVLEVIQNLLISHVEFRTEESLDVAPYVFQRSLETVVVPLDKKLEEVRDEYLKILEQYVKTLIRFNVVQGNCCSLTKGKIFMIMKDFQNKNRGTNSSNYSEIMRCLNICVTLYHAFELLIRHGLRNFLSFYDEHIEKPLLRGNLQLRSIVNNVREYLGPIPNIEVLPDGTYPEIPKNITFGHPKYYKLRDVLVTHFSQAKENSRVIVFFEYRESVMEAHTMLLQSRPLIQPKIFLGQGSGITQKVQIGVVKAFREGRCNTLLSTCIGEEGLDVGEVDLIICFDISNKSPIRMVQRMGRTGRKREGRIVVLVTEGKEQQTLKDCLIHKNNISTYVLESKQLNTGMYPDSPRLLPTNLNPRCEKMFITVKKIVKKNSVKDMLKSLSSKSSEPVFSQEISISDIQERIPKTTMFFDKGRNMYKDEEAAKNPIFYRFIEKQRSAQKTYKVKHSRYTTVLTDLLRSADSKRFNLPSQVHSLTQGNSSKNLKQSDIRNMFLKKSSQQDFQQSQIRTEVLQDIPTQIIVKDVEGPLDVSDDPNIPKELFTLVSNYLFTQMANPVTQCKHCPRGFHCEDFAVSTAPSLMTNNNYWVPNEDILDTISLTDLENFSKSLDPTQNTDEDDFSQLMDNADSYMFDTVDFTQLEKEAGLINDRNVIPDIEKSFNFEAPKTYSSLLNKFRNSILLSQNATPEAREPVDGNNKINSQVSEKSLLEFFMLDSATDIYGNTSLNSSQDTVIYSQTFSDVDTDQNDLCNRFKSPSPILSLDERRKKRREVERSHNQVCDSSTFSATSRDLFTNLQTLKNDNNVEKQTSNIDINDFYDLSYFGISDSKVEEINVDKSKVVDIEQICDLSQFGILLDESKVTKQNTSLEKNINDYMDDSINKHNSNFHSNSSCDDILDSRQNFNKKPCANVTTKTSTPQQKCYDTSNFKAISKIQTTTQHTSPVMDMEQTYVERDLSTHRTDLNKKLGFTLEEYAGFNIKCNVRESKFNFTENPSCSNDYENSDVFKIATQPHSLTTKTKVTVKDPDQTFDGTNFDLPTQRTNLNRKCDSQKSSFIDDYGESELFIEATQPNISNKSHILTSRNNAFKSRDNFNFSKEENEEIECVDLTLLSPTPTNEKCILSCQSQLPITQMLSLLNKTSQKENLNMSPERSNAASTQKVQSLRNGKNIWLSKSSTKKNKAKAKSSIKSQLKSDPREEIDPYLFSKNFQNNKKKTVEKSPSSSDEFEDSVFLKPNLSSIKPRKKCSAGNTKDQGKRTKKKTNEFLDLEAQLSDDENLIISEDEDEENNEFYDKSFVNDETQNFDTQMHAKYLQSVRSPANLGRFKIPIKRAVNISNVYSQPPSTELDTYLEDSFCVDDDDVELSQQTELSQLEILERKLKQKKKRKKSDDKDGSKPKRRRVICFSSDDSD